MIDTLYDFVASGVQTVQSIGKGVNRGKVLNALIAAVISTNAIAQPVLASHDKEPAQLSIANYEQVISQKINTVMNNPIVEGQVITFLFEKPTTEFLESNFGKSFSNSLAYSGVKELVESDDFYKSGLHISHSEHGDIDPNFTSVSKPSTGSYKSPSDLFQSQLEDFTFWHEVYHTDPSQSTSSQVIDTDSSVLMAETGADVFAAMVLAKKNSSTVDNPKSIALETVDALIDLRNFAGFDRDHVDAVHLSQPGLYILREAIAEGRIEPSVMSLPAMKQVADDISVATMQADLSQLVKHGIDSLPSRYAPATESFFSRHLQAAKVNGVGHLESLYALRGEYYAGATQAYSHAMSNPVEFSKMIATEAGIAAYAKQLSEMRGGENFDGRYDLTHPYAHAALKAADSVQREAIFSEIAHKAFQRIDAAGCLKQNVNACLGVDADVYRSQLTETKESNLDKLSSMYSSVLKAMEGYQDVAPVQQGKTSTPSMR